MSRTYTAADMRGAFMRGTSQPANGNLESHWNAARNAYPDEPADPGRCMGWAFGARCHKPEGHEGAHEVLVPGGKLDPTAEALTGDGTTARPHEAPDRDPDEAASAVWSGIARRGAAAAREMGTSPATEPGEFTVSPAEETEWLMIQAADRAVLLQKRAQYGASWKRRGGTGAYHVGIRHADRIEAIAARHGCDLWAALDSTPADGDESMLNAIGDLRRYLLLWEGEHRLRQGKAGA